MLTRPKFMRVQTIEGGDESKIQGSSKFLVFPAKQEAAPGETSPETGQQDVVVLLNPFSFNGFRKAYGNRRRRRVGVPVDIDGDTGIVQIHLFHSSSDDAQIRLVGDIELDVLDIDVILREDLL